MRSIKRILAVMLIAALLAAAYPGFAAGGAENTRSVHERVKLDFDPEGGYEGDYVVIYNPSEDTSTGISTGSLSGKIETSISSNALPASEPAGNALYRIDVDGELMEETRRLYAGREIEKNPVRADYPVGTTKSFYVSYQNPDGAAGNITFKVLYVGAHCRIWTPVGNGSNGNYHPLDGIDTSYAKMAADAFDSKFDLMLYSYGEFMDTNSDGKINLMFYNVEDGWQPGSGGYIGGYFSASDFYNQNQLPMIHIDTYPGVYNGSGSDITGVYSTLVHEFQHLINFSNTRGWMDTWLNEALSGSAEELCFPGDALLGRICSWRGNYYVNYSADEYRYDSTCAVHKGGALAAWDSSLETYALGLFFSQYLYNKFGTTAIYKQLIDEVLNDTDDYYHHSFGTLAAATGTDAETIWRDFFVSVAANAGKAGYGFRLNEGYDPSTHYGIEDPYELLAPVVFTGTSASIKGSGFITVKPVGGVFVPPTNAGSGLKYVGITLDPEDEPQTGLLGDADGNGAIEPVDALLILRYYMGIIDGSQIHLENCDYDKSGVINPTDALLVLRKAMGII